MSVMIRFALGFLLLVTVCEAQNTCAVETLGSIKAVDGIPARSGVLAAGSFRTSVLFLQPVIGRKPHPPVLFSFSELKVAKNRIELLPVAIQLAKAGAIVMLLEGSLVWEPNSVPTGRDTQLLDCASDWFLSQKDLDVLHTTYVGPKMLGETGKLRLPSGFVHTPKPGRGDLWVPLGETQDGNDTLAFTKPEVRDRLISVIEQHWLVETAEIGSSSSK